VRHELHRQIVGFEDAIGGEIGERHLGRREQVIVLVLDMEEFVTELRQLARARQGRRVHQHRCIGLEITVLTRMQVEHELRERAVQARELTLENDEAAPGQPATETEVHGIAHGAEIHVVLWLEIEAGRLAPLALLAVVVLVVAGGHALVGQVGNAERDALELALDGGEARLVSLELVPEARYFFQ
jgi:hypothetical protein